MINKEAKLNPNLFDELQLERLPTRDGFGYGLVEAGKRDERIVALTADLAESTRAEWFQKEFPERFVDVGVAEQNLATVASGMSNVGKIPFITSYATFSPGRNWEQIRTTICINDVPVKVIGNHAGLTVGPDGGTHQALEDIALMRALPNMTVVVPADSHQAYQATLAIAQTDKPAYLRLGREKMPVFTTSETPFVLGKAQVLYEQAGAKVGIIACGSLVYEALLAAEELREKNIPVSVLNLHTIKPLDREGILEFVQDLDLVVTAEEHQVAAGMGSAVAELLVQNNPKKVVFVGIHDRFGESGDPVELLHAFGLDKKGIIKAIKENL